MWRITYRSTVLQVVGECHTSIDITCPFRLPRPNESPGRPKRFTHNVGSHANSSGGNPRPGITLRTGHSGSRAPGQSPAPQLAACPRRPGHRRLCPGLFPLARRKLGNGGRSGPGKSSTNGWRLTGNRNRVPDNPAPGADTDETTPQDRSGLSKPEVRTAPTGRIPICISIFRHIGRFRYRLLVSCWYIW